MKVTVCELPNEQSQFPAAWEKLAEHVARERSDLVLLPEMPFYRWLAQERLADDLEWAAAVAAHESWIGRLGDLSPALVLSTRPVIRQGIAHNAGYLWEDGQGLREVHDKYYLPDEPGFWEASWYARGDGRFTLAQTNKGRIGFLICTEIWFFQHARAYGQQGAEFIACPRATPNPTAPKWVAGGQAAAVVSGAFCLSSNLAGTTAAGGDFAGVGWIIEPHEGQVLGLTTPEKPYLTLDIDLEDAQTAKKGYPRYVRD